MKKAIAILSALVMTGSLFAETVGAPSISASAETKWGVNLDVDNATGFENSASVTVSIPFNFEAPSAEGKADIAVSGVELTYSLNDSAFSTESTGSVDAKINFGNAYVVIGTATGVDKNYATSVDVNPYDLTSTDFTGKAGLGLGFANDLFTAELVLASDAGYNTYEKELSSITVGSTAYTKELTSPTTETQYDATNTENLYNAHAVVTVSPADVANVEVAFGSKTRGTEAMKDYYVGAKLHGTIVEGLTYEVPADVLLENDVTSIELAPTVSFEKDAITVSATYYNVNIDKAVFAATENTKVDYAELSVGYTADLFNVTLDTLFGDLTTNNTEDTDLYFSLSTGINPIDGVAITNEVTFDLVSEQFAAPTTKVELTEAFTGINNTTITVAYEGFAAESKAKGDNTKGIFYVGAAINL